MRARNRNVRNIIGAVIGDIAGSVYEFDNYRSKDFVLFGDYDGSKCFATDDSIMTLAVAKALLDADENGGVQRHVDNYFLVHRFCFIISLRSLSICLFSSSTLPKRRSSRRRRRNSTLTRRP